MVSPVLAVMVEPVGKEKGLAAVLAASP